MRQEGLKEGEDEKKILFCQKLRNRVLQALYYLGLQYYLVPILEDRALQGVPLVL